MKDTLLCAGLLAILVVALRPGLAAAYVPSDRWSVTASGATGAAGTPITLTWSFAADDTAIPNEGPSNLISYFDGLFNVSTTSSDLTQRPWFKYFDQSFQRWSDLGGITFKYEGNDDGAPLYSSSGATDVRGDVRIGGAFVDGVNGTLAYTWLPDSGDVVVDTGETDFYSNSTGQYLQLRNTITHELGHAFGLLHVESSDAALLMEPILNTSFDGPQLDDIRGIQGLYGDAKEKTNGGLGNGTYQLATPLGSLAAGDNLAIGTDAEGDQSVSPLETDFVSIANSSDIDFFSFTIASPTLLDATLTPLGGVFNQGVEGGIQSTFDANARNDLSLAVFASNGTTLLGSANLTGAGGTEMLSDLELSTPGTYFARISGSSDNVQLYELELSAGLLLTGLPGDYNGDNLIDAADYLVWRDALASGSPLLNDPNGNGIADSADFDYWRDHFGQTSGSGAGASASAAAVPEPSTVLLAIAATVGSALMRRAGSLQA
jgi:serralysin